MTFLTFAIALLIDYRFGWPKPLFATISHPVVWAGNAISFLEKKMNAGTENARLIKGGFAACLLIMIAFLMGTFITQILHNITNSSFITAVCTAIFAWPLLASQSMKSHITDILGPLERSNMEQARTAVSMIVGRDPSTLDENGIRRAAIESLAENTSDGIIAPLFWGLCLGLPGIMAYKMINTLDSMIGYKNDRYLYFGRIAARIDDVANWIPARLTALIYAICEIDFSILKGIASIARMHRSPNAGWPETAMARILNIRLSGPRIYGNESTNDAWLNEGAPDPDNVALASALLVFDRLIRLTIGVLFACVLAYWIGYEIFTD